VVGEEDDEPVIVTGRHLAPVRALVGGVHLGEPRLQPAGLVVVQAAGGAPGQAVGVQRDEAGSRRVMRVVSGAVQPVPLGEPVPGRPRAGAEVGCHEFLPGDGPAPGIGRDGQGRAGHERLRALGEQVQRPFMVEPVRQAGGLAVPGQRPGDALGLGADALVECLVVAEAGKPRDLQAGRGELAQRPVQQARVMREAVVLPEVVGPAAGDAVRLPEDVVRPVQ
jgi:hypothetical protein